MEFEHFGQKQFKILETKRPKIELEDVRYSFWNICCYFSRMSQSYRKEKIQVSIFSAYRRKVLLKGSECLKLLVLLLTRFVCVFCKMFSSKREHISFVSLGYSAGALVEEEYANQHHVNASALESNAK